jgi:hypothetical protein
MNPDTIFQIANTVVLIGWLALLASPWIPVWSQRVAAMIIPGLLSIAYAGLILAFWANAEGGFGSLRDVSRLFETPELLLAGWLHFLAFDLFVGAWIVRDARARSLPFWMALICLPFTFLFGPAGFAAWLAIRAMASGVLRTRAA